MGLKGEEPFFRIEPRTSFVPFPFQERVPSVSTAANPDEQVVSTDSIREQNGIVVSARALHKKGEGTRFAKAKLIKEFQKDFPNLSVIR